MNAPSIPLGPDHRLRLAVELTPEGAVLELGVERASPADQSTDRFHPTAERLEIPVRALRAFRDSLPPLIAAAFELEFQRPLTDPGGPPSPPCPQPSEAS